MGACLVVLHEVQGACQQAAAALAAAAWKQQWHYSVSANHAWRTACSKASKWQRPCMLRTEQRLAVLGIIRTCCTVGAVGFSPQVPQSESSFISDWLELPTRQAAEHSKRKRFNFLSVRS